jgi:hypothetical protein
VWFNPGCAWNPDDVYAGWIDQSGRAGKIRAGVGTPLAEKADDLWLPIDAIEFFFSHSVFSPVDSSHIEVNIA